MATEAGSANGILRILVSGDRNWTDKEAIRRELEKRLPCVVIHGCARGADTLAGQVAFELGMEVVTFPAEWHLYGKAAGPRRNQTMLDLGKPDLVLAFHADLANSKGTKHMVEIARTAGVSVEVFTA